MQITKIKLIIIIASILLLCFLIDLLIVKKYTDPIILQNQQFIDQSFEQKSAFIKQELDKLNTKIEDIEIKRQNLEGKLTVIQTKKNNIEKPKTNNDIINRLKEAGYEANIK